MYSAYLILLHDTNNKLLWYVKRKNYEVSHYAMVSIFPLFVLVRPKY
jgi:hypothetical protein